MNIERQIENNTDDNTAPGQLPFVSVIIPTIRESEVLRACLESLCAQTYPQKAFEIILVSQRPIDMKVFYLDDNVNIYTISGVEYRNSRNAAAEKARGELFAFVDDDCIIPPDWLSACIRYMRTTDVSVVGGPAMPFAKDTFSYRWGGYLLASPFAVGFANARYRPLSHAQETGEHNLLTANTLVRRSAFEAVSGFDSNQTRSEDSDFYFRVKKKGYHLLYVPEVFVWHRSKPIFLPLVKKVFYYAVGRALLMMRKPETIRLMYFVPSICAGIFFVSTIVSLFSSRIAVLFMAGVLLYLWANGFHALYIFATRERSIPGLFAIFFTTPFIHFSYAMGILFGIIGYARKARVETWR